MQPSFTLLKVLDLVPFGQTGQPSHFALRLSRPEWETWRPGQFLMLRPLSFGKELPWGRPLSICHMTARHLICFFKIAGEGTRRMAGLKSGDLVEVWGPLGTGFAMELEQPTAILAGGMGIVPFVGYVALHPKPWLLTMLFGHRQPRGCFPVDSINDHIPVDSMREHDKDDLDNFLFALEERIQDCAQQKGLVVACGPLPFLQKVQELSAQFDCRTQISVETRMACGVGACLGCTCLPTNHWPGGRHLPVRTCTEGPVFWADQVTLPTL